MAERADIDREVSTEAHLEEALPFLAMCDRLFVWDLRT